MSRVRSANDRSPRSPRRNVKNQVQSEPLSPVTTSSNNRRKSLEMDLKERAREQHSKVLVEVAGQAYRKSASHPKVFDKTSMRWIAIFNISNQPSSSCNGVNLGEETRQSPEKVLEGKLAPKSTNSPVVPNKRKRSGTGMRRSRKPKCLVCKSRPREVLLLPCSHLCVCRDCSKQNTQTTGTCPLCESSIQRGMLLF